MLERELAVMLGRWQQRVGIGTSLRWAADALARAARSGARVQGGGGQQRLLCMAQIAGGTGQSCREDSGVALLVALGLLLLSMAGCWGQWVGGGCRCVCGGHSHSVGVGTLVSEEEGPNNQHEVEGVEDRRRGEHYKG